MDEQEWLRRIDGHLETSKHYMREGHELMARIDATLDRNTAAFERNKEAFDRNTEAFDRNAGAFLDLQGFLQQVTTVLGALVTEQREWRKEQREESRAFLNALFSILDRLDKQPPPSAA